MQPDVFQAQGEGFDEEVEEHGSIIDTHEQHTRGPQPAFPFAIESPPHAASRLTFIRRAFFVARQRS